MPSPLQRLVQQQNVAQYSVFTGSAVVTEPVEEPVTLAATKLHCRVDISDDDAVITALIVAARKLIERTIGRSLVTQTREVSFDWFPNTDTLTLPAGPLVSISSITTYDENNDASVFSTDAYYANTFNDGACLNSGYSWPTDLRATGSVVVQYVAGYGDASDVPGDIRQALLMLVAHWYNNREAVLTGSIATEIPFGAQALLNSYRMLRV